MSPTDTVEDGWRRQGRRLPDDAHRLMLLFRLSVLAQHRRCSSEVAKVVSKRNFVTTLHSRCKREFLHPCGLKTNFFSRLMTSSWTSHSARALLRSATTAWGVPRVQRDNLGGWSAPGSDRYTRAAARMITNLQALVIKARDEGWATEDSFAEAQTGSQLDDHLWFKECALEKALPRRSETEVQQQTLEESDHPQADDLTLESERTEEESVDPNATREKRLKSENTQTEILGINPEATRQQARSQLQAQCYVSVSDRNSDNVLHRLVSCNMLLGIVARAFACYFSEFVQCFPDSFLCGASPPA